MIFALCVAIGILGVLSGTHAKELRSIDDILASMDLAAKIGQMIQLDIQMFQKAGTSDIDMERLKSYIQTYQIGSVLNSPFSGGPQNGDNAWTATEWRTVIQQIQSFATETKSAVPIIYGIDSIHGATFVEGAALFPQAINLAATFNPDLAWKAGQVTSKDTRAAGIPWIFAPVLGLGLQPLWARFPETFGEDAYLAGQMGASIIKGLQVESKDGGVPKQTAACMKHFIAYSIPTDGHDRSPVQLPDRILRQLYIPSFQAAIDAGVMTGMESYQEVGGVPMVSSKDYLKTLIRKQMNFTGFLVTDYAEIENLHDWHKVAETQRDAVKIAMQDTTIDMSMVPMDVSFFDYMIDLVQKGEIPESRVDTSVRRILQVKEQLGLFENNGLISVEDPLVSTVGSDEDWKASLDSARESITLAKNENGVLPLRDTQKIFITGPTANSAISLTGGWAIHWQGVFDESEFSRKKTILDGLYDLVAKEQITYTPGVGLEDSDLSKVDIDAIKEKAKDSDVIVICIGEGTYAEKPGDIDDLALPQGQIDYVQALKSLSKPVVLVVVEGRPRLIHDAVTSSDAVLLAYEPGPLGGTAVAETLLGKNIPSGRLPFSYPLHQATVMYPYHHKNSDQCIDIYPPHGAGYKTCDVEFEFGHGLSYSSFEYSDLKISHAAVNEETQWTVSVDVKNTGSVAAKHTVMLFLFDMIRRVTPEYKLLKRFEKVNLQPGQVAQVQWKLNAEDLKYFGVDSKFILESGEIRVGISHDVDCRSSDAKNYIISTADATSNGQSMCTTVNVDVTENYHPVCDEACSMWSPELGGGICGTSLDADTCRKTCISQGWTWDYVNCITNYFQETSCTDVSSMQCFNPFSEGNLLSQHSTEPLSRRAVENTQSFSSGGSASNESDGYSQGILILVSLLSGFAGVIVGSLLAAYYFLTRDATRAEALKRMDKEISASNLAKLSKRMDHSETEQFLNKSVSASVTGHSRESLVRAALYMQEEGLFLEEGQASAH